MWNCGAEGRQTHGNQLWVISPKAAAVAVADSQGRSREKANNTVGGQPLGEYPGAGQVSRWASQMAPTSPCEMERSRCAVRRNGTYLCGT